MRLEGLFGLYHLLFLLIMILMGSATIYVFYAKLKDEKIRIMVLKILSAIWFLVGLAHQITLTYEMVELHHTPGWTWATLIPFTYCSFASFVTPLVLIFFKKDNRVLHCLAYLCFYGGFSVFFAPWLTETSSFFLASSLLAFIHHAFMFVMSILLLMIKYVKPSMKRLYIYPVGFALIILLGVFEKYVLKFPHGMMVGEPLLDTMPHLTSWWGLWIGGTFLTFIIIFFYEFVIYKKHAKEIFDVRGIFDGSDTTKSKQKKDKEK